ncbi:MAG: hypothetical protein FWC26_12380 [Fibromonadales bacterium]|nr:hypothetical protein [Fibromonadales bacterium]
MIKRAECLIFCGLLASNALAWNPDPQIIEAQAPQTAFAQLADFQNAARPEYDAYLTAGIIYLPLPSQSELKTKWGTHEGFAFRQRLGLWLADRFDDKDPEGLKYGFGWFGERQGWDNEDFLFIPHRGNYSQINQIHAFGFTVADSINHWLLGGGVQYLNAKEESLRWWLLGTWSRFSVMPAFDKGDLQFVNAQLFLQARKLRGDKNSWQNYLPDLECTYYSKDSLRMFVSQNVFKQRLYLEGAYSEDFTWVAIKYYPEPSRFILALEATATKKENGDFYFGGGITLPILRVAYNHANDYEAFFKSRGLWIVEIRLAIGTSGDSFFALNAPKPAPNEISQTPVKKQEFNQEKEK